MIGEQCRIHDEYGAVPGADGMTLIGSLGILGMIPSVRVDRSFYIEEFGADRDAIFVNRDLVQILRCSDDHR